MEYHRFYLTARAIDATTALIPDCELWPKLMKYQHFRSDANAVDDYSLNPGPREKVAILLECHIRNRE